MSKLPVTLFGYLHLDDDSGYQLVMAKTPKGNIALDLNCHSLDDGDAHYFHELVGQRACVKVVQHSYTRKGENGNRIPIYSYTVVDFIPLSG